jgi:DNA-directed RNA polymerase subunit RPC12/RpoP
MSAQTYAEKAPIRGSKLTCPRCSRAHPFPKPDKPVRCECGWRYFIGPRGELLEDFAPPMDL